MNIFADILFLFIYLSTLFYLRIPDITNNNYLFHKLIIFISIFAFRYIVEIIKKIKNGSKVEPMKVFENALYYALFGIIGYSIYIDLMYMNFSCNAFSINIDGNVKRFIVSAFIISLFILLTQTGKLIFNYNQ